MQGPSSQYISRVQSLERSESLLKDADDFLLAHVLTFPLYYPIAVSFLATLLYRRIRET
jgi:hypothetical protein